MKFDAHPIVVAVALGLLGPGALSEEDDELSTCASCSKDETTGWEPGPAPDPEEFHRVALAWESLSSPAEKLKVG